MKNKLICIGDSLTFGYGVYTFQCWVSKLQELIGFDVKNAGVNGDTIVGILERNFQDVILQNPTCAIVMAGTNDFILGRSLESVLKSIDMIISEMLSNDIVPIIGIEIPVEPIMANEMWASGVNYILINKNILTYRDSILEKIKMSKDIFCIDFYKVYRNITQKRIREYYIDGIHPTAKGHALMAECAFEFLKENKIY
jgi:acyl-CoA thioesterase I